LFEVPFIQNKASFGGSLSAIPSIATIRLQWNPKEKMIAPAKILVSAPFEMFTSVEAAAPARQR
jgi:hypothetical protein